MKTLIGVYIVLVAAVLLLTAEVVPVSSTENFAKLAAVGVAAVSGLMAFVASLVTVKAARELEQLKTEAARGTEKLKVVISMRMDAHRDLMSAANSYYRTLADLERGRWNSASSEKAEGEMTRAESNLALLPGGDVANLWQQFWQASRVIAELANDMGPRGGNALKELWKSEGPKLGDLLQQLRNEERRFLASLEGAGAGTKTAAS